MPLGDVQDQSLASIVNTISSNQEARSTLEKIFSEAESSKEGRGDILRCLGRKKKSVLLSSKTKSAAVSIIIKGVRNDFKNTSIIGTGDRGNRWSLVTY